MRVRPRRKPDRGPFVNHFSPMDSDRKKSKKKTDMRNITRLSNGNFRVNMRGLSPNWKQGRHGDYIGTYPSLAVAMEVRDILRKHQRINRRQAGARRQPGLSLEQAREMDAKMKEEEWTRQCPTPFPVTPVRLIKRSKSSYVITKSPIIMTSGKSKKVQIPAGTPAIVMPDEPGSNSSNPLALPVLERQDTLGFAGVVDLDPFFELSPPKGRNLGCIFEFEE